VIYFGGQLACVVMVAADDSWLDPAVPGRVLRSYRSSAPTTPSDNGHQGRNRSGRIACHRPMPAAVPVA
jgi:hypothetical protein